MGIIAYVTALVALGNINKRKLLIPSVMSRLVYCEGWPALLSVRVAYPRGNFHTF